MKHISIKLTERMVHDYCLYIKMSSSFAVSMLIISSFVACKQTVHPSFEVQQKSCQNISLSLIHSLSVSSSNSDSLLGIIFSLLFLNFISIFFIFIFKFCLHYWTVVFGKNNTFIISLSLFSSLISCYYLLFLVQECRYFSLNAESIKIKFLLFFLYETHSGEGEGMGQYPVLP